MASYRFIFYLSINFICTIRLNHATFDQQKNSLQSVCIQEPMDNLKRLLEYAPDNVKNILMRIISLIDSQDGQFAENIKKLLEESNEAKFSSARAILDKTQENIREQMRAYLKEIIMFSYHPRELYTNKKLQLTRWGQWVNIQKNNQGIYCQVTPDDIHTLFECYNLPQSLEHYTRFNEQLFEFQKIDPVRRYAYSSPLAEKDVSALREKLKTLECVLYDSLKKELADSYGIELEAEHVKMQYDCTFKAHLAVTSAAEKKLQKYIDMKLPKF